MEKNTPKWLVKSSFLSLGFLAGYGLSQLIERIRRENATDWRKVVEEVAAKTGMKILVNPTPQELAQATGSDALLVETGTLVATKITKNNEISISIEDKEGTFRGELGIGVRSVHPGQLDFWMFDKNDLETTAQLFAFGIKAEEDESNTIFFTQDTIIKLESATLRAELRLDNVIFADDGDRATYTISVWKK